METRNFSYLTKGMIIGQSLFIVKGLTMFFDLCYFLTIVKDKEQYSISVDFETVGRQINFLEKPYG